MTTLAVMLGLLAVLACTAGFKTEGAWRIAYADWNTIGVGLSNKLGAFIKGSASFIEALGVPSDLAIAFIAVIVVSFALTTLDSATRLLRFNVSEIGGTLGLDLLNNRFVATIIACAAICFFAFYKIDGKPAGLVLWTLFGITNQLLAGLALLVVSLYLHQRGRNALYTALPMLFMLVSTLTAMISKLKGFYDRDQYLLLAVGAALFAIAAGIIIEGFRAFARRDRYSDDLIVFADRATAPAHLPKQ